MKITVPKKLFSGLIEEQIPKADNIILSIIKLNQITLNFYKFIKGLPKPGNYKFSHKLKAQLQLLKDSGVDINGVTPNMLDTATKLRLEVLKKSSPENWNLHNIPLFPTYSNIKGIKNNKVIGDIDLILDKLNNVHVGMVRNLTSDLHGILERMTNAGINTAHSWGGKGLISGETLVLPLKTMKMYPKYTDKEILGNYGEWKQVGDNLPVYLLKSPTYSTPTKSELFDPSIIDLNGVMHINWKDPNIFKILIPLIGGGYVYSRN